MSLRLPARPSSSARLIPAGLLLVAAMGLAGAVMAQETRSATDGVFTAAQAARGKALYFETCLQCHGGELQGVEDRPSLNGQPFFEHFGGRPVEALFTFLNRSMPQGAPGILGAAGNADVVAFLLSQNDFPAGDRELPADPKALSAIIIDRPGAAR